MYTNCTPKHIYAKISLSFILIHISANDSIVKLLLYYCCALYAFLFGCVEYIIFINLDEIDLVAGGYMII